MSESPDEPMQLGQPLSTGERRHSLANGGHVDESSRSGGANATPGSPQTGVPTSPEPTRALKHIKLIKSKKSSGAISIAVAAVGVAA
jgi:hypothetical protein